MDPTLSRRTLLAAGIGLVAAAACGSGDDDAATRATTTIGPASRATGPDELAVAAASALLIAGRAERFTAGVFELDNTIVDSGAVEFSFGRSLDRLGPPQPARLHTQGIEERAYWETTYSFDEPGEWYAVARANGKTGATAIRVVDRSSTKIPIEGDRLIPFATATAADPKGVASLCTRVPACPFHDVSLDAALAEGRPVALLFAAPKLCLSRVCGPVLDVLMEQHATYGERVRFVHVEVYKSLEADLSDASNLVDAVRAYNLTFEPILYVAGADGVIRKRLDGPYDRIECAAALQQVAT